MKSTFITLGLLLATTQARTLKSLLQTDEDLVSLDPANYGFPSDCNFTFPTPGGPGAPGSPPIGACVCVLGNGTAAGFPPLGQAVLVSHNAEALATSGAFISTLPDSQINNFAAAQVC